MIKRRTFFPMAWLRKARIRYRLISSLILVALLPLFISSYIAFGTSRSAIEHQASVFSVEIVKQVAHNLRVRMSAIENNAEALVLSDRVQAGFTRYTSTSAVEKALAFDELGRVLLGNFGSFQYVSQKYFLDTDNQVIDAQVFPQLSQVVVDFAENIPLQAERSYWGTLETGAGQQSVVLLRKINFKSNSRLAGSLFLGIKQTHFSEIFDNVELGRSSDIYVLDAKDGRIVVNTIAKSGNLAETVADPALVEKIRANMQGIQVSEFVSYTSHTSGHTMTGEKFVAAFTRVPRTSWYVVTTTPYDTLGSDALDFLNQIVLIGLLCLVLALVASFWIARSITEPLEALVQAMKATEDGTYHEAEAPQGNDELSELSQKFSDMAQTLRQEREQLEQRVAQRTQDLEAANNQLAALSTTDGLTGIANRRRFDAVLAEEWARAQRSGQALAVAMLDIDWFKNYNDHYGHLAGDECLRQVARTFSEHILRTGDLVARYGGEEFVFVAPATDAHSAGILAHKVRQAVFDLALAHAASGFGRVTVSIGVAVRVPTLEGSPQELVAQADRALYTAKKLGRNRVEIAE